MIQDSPFSIKVDNSILLFIPREEWGESVFFAIDQNRTYLRRWLPWLDDVKQPKDSVKFLKQNLEAYGTGIGFVMGILYENEFVGFIGIHGFDTLNKIASLGYWLVESAEGKGVMTRAVIRIIDYLYDVRGMNRIYIRCASGNQQSRNIPIRLGFTHEGVQREAEWLYDHFVDLQIYSILRKEWPGREVIQEQWEYKQKRTKIEN